MRVAISAEWIGAEAGGPEIYTSNTIRALATLPTEHRFTLYACDHAPQTWREEMGRTMDIRLVGASRKTAIPYGITRELLRRPVDLFHATYVAPPYCPGRFVLSILDLGFEINPEFFPFPIRKRLQYLSRWGARRAERILTLSEHAKGTIVDLYRVEPERVVVTYLAASERFGSDPAPGDGAVRAKYKLPGEYILYVGKIQARKNAPRLMRAYDRLRKEVPDCPPLVIAGMRTWKSDETFQAIDELGLEPHLVFTGHVPDEDLPALYRGANQFVYPSLFEGFGIPPLEAMACGVPVVASRATSIPEVVGDAGLLFDPFSFEEMAACMRRLLEDSTLRKETIAKGIERAKQFTWTETARQTLAVYDALAQ